MRTTLLQFLFLLVHVYVSAQHQEYEFRVLLGNVIAEGQDVALDSKGNIYVADSYSVVSFYPDGRFRKEYTIGKEDYLWNVCNGVALDSQDNLYILSTYSGTITKISNDGEVLHQFGGTGTAAGLFTSPSGIAVDVADFIYIADTGNNRIQKFDNNGTFILQYGQEGTAIGSFRVPAQIATDAGGNVYVADKENGRIQKFDEVGTPLMQYTIPDQPKAFKPFDVALDADGNVYTTDAANFRIAKFDNEGQVSESIGFYYDPSNTVTATDAKLAIDANRNIYIAEQLSYYYAGSPGKSARLQKLNPDGIMEYALGRRLGKGSYNLEKAAAVTIDAVGNFYVASRNGYSIDMFDKRGRRIQTFGSYGTGNGQFQHYITDLHLDASGNLYVLSYSQDGYIQKFDSQGNFLSKFAKPEAGITSNPRKIALDLAGNLYLLDEKYIHKYNKAGKRENSFTLKDPKSGKDITYYQAIAFDRRLNLYIIHNYSIKKYDANGKFLQQIGSYGKEPDRFQQPTALVLDAKGNIYVNDYNTIKKLDPAGNFIGYVRQASRRITYSGVNMAISPDGTRLIACGNDTDGNVMMYVSTEVYTATNNLITGNIYADEDADCQKGEREQGIANIVVEASPGPYFGITDERGNYSIEVGTGSYTLRQLLPNDKGRTIVESCPPLSTGTPLQFTGYHAISADQNFANRVTLSPYLSVSVSSDRRRRCFESTTTVRYVNSGFATAPDAKVYLQLPPEVELLAADKAYSRLPDGTYEFAVGDLAAGQQGTITITDIVTCGDESVRGRTVCTRAWITPSNNAPAQPTPTVTITGRCDSQAGMIRFVIRNSGKADMDKHELFRKFRDGRLASVEQFQLAAGDSMVLWVPSMGYTWRLEADQPEGNGDNKTASVTIEACSDATSGTTVSSGFVNLMPTDDEEAEVSEECVLITDSFDPNDKLVTPVGRTEENYTPTNTALKYKIRFQNTGTDVAYRVVVVDTLSEHLDLSTLQMGAASHTHRFEVSGKGRPVLTWTFDNIMLPDSTADEPGSHGYIQFSIKPKADLAEKTAVENFADIFFDFNSPVRTNVTLNRIYDMPAVVDEEVRVRLEDVLATPAIAAFEPAAGKFGAEITIMGKRFASIAADNKVYLNGKAATVVSATNAELRVLVPEGVTTGALKVITPDGGVTSLETFEVYQPPVLSSFSPAEGVVGQTVTLHGQHLSIKQLPQVYLGDQLCQVNRSETGSLQILIPADATTGKFKVYTEGGEVTHEQVFKVWHQPVISALSKHADRAGSELRITGAHFATQAERNKVYLGQAQALVLQATENSLLIKVPATAATGKVKVLTPGGEALSNEVFELIPAPVLTQMIPTKGSVSTVVELRGQHFLTYNQQDTVLFNGIKAPVLSASPELLRVSVPRGVSSGKVEVKGKGGSAFSVENFIVEDLTLAESIIISPNPSNGSFNVDLSRADFDLQQLQVYSSLGQLVLEQRIPVPRPDLLQVQLPKPQAGIYLLHLHTTRGLLTYKLYVH